jgi:hypothetical protein
MREMAEDRVVVDGDALGLSAGRHMADRGFSEANARREQQGAPERHDKQSIHGLSLLGSLLPLVLARS